MASQNGMPQDYATQMALWAKGGAALRRPDWPRRHLRRTPPAARSDGWWPKSGRSCQGGRLLRRRRARRVAAGALGRLTATRTLANIKGIPMLYLTAEDSGRTRGARHRGRADQVRRAAEHMNLKDRGILGNGHFAMIESNRKQVFEVISDWVSRKA